MNKNTKSRKANYVKNLKAAHGAKSGILSTSSAKNLRMVVLHNEDGNGNKCSITRFEPINEHKNVYRRFAVKPQ